MSELQTPVALVTGASRGLGRALLRELVARGWHVLANGRDADALAQAAASTGNPAAVRNLPGDVADPLHRHHLAWHVARAGRLDLLVNNASSLGAVPLPALARYPMDDLERAFAVNTVAPLRLFQLVLPVLERTGGRVVNVSSDAAVEAYPGWGGYGASKAALDQLSAGLAVEHPTLRVYSFDPGEMDTDLARAAGLDDGAAPETVVPALLRLATGDLPSGRYTASALRSLAVA